MQPNSNSYLPPDYQRNSGSRGEKPVTLIVISVIAVILLAGSLYFGYKYFNLTQNFEHEVGLRIEEAKKEQKAEDEARFAEIQKNPFRTYEAPGFVGDLAIKYPKNWSMHVEEEERGSTTLKGIAHPNRIPAGRVNSDLNYAFRFELKSNLYDDELRRYENSISSGNVSAKSVKVDEILSTRIEGEISRDVNGSVVLIPIRDKTLLLFNENNDYSKDFNEILKRMVISP